LEIPSYLQISAELRTRAWQTWRGWQPASETRVSGNGTSSAIQQELAERRRAKTAGRLSKMLARKAERDAVSSIPRSRLRWDVNTSRHYDDAEPRPAVATLMVESTA
jgi:hypothetical protein